ncbi:MAG: protocatechuate 3,4-dioxygenase subunit beta, partial [Hyphomicrobiaceae bacterium TMED74]
MVTEQIGKRDWSSHPAYISEGYKSTKLRGPTKPLIPITATLSELTGPVYGHDSLGELDTDLTRNGAKSGEPLGDRIIVEGIVRDEGEGQLVSDAMIEIWQADSQGRFGHPNDPRPSNS